MYVVSVQKQQNESMKNENQQQSVNDFLGLQKTVEDLSIQMMLMMKLFTVQQQQQQQQQQFQRNGMFNGIQLGTQN